MYIRLFSVPARKPANWEVERSILSSPPSKEDLAWFEARMEKLRESGRFLGAEGLGALASEKARQRQKAVTLTAARSVETQPSNLVGLTAESSSLELAEPADEAGALVPA
jgi:hypothetical protein